MITVKKEIIDQISEAIYNRIMGRASAPIKLPSDFPDNEIRQLIEYVNQMEEEYNHISEFTYTIAKGELDYSPPKGKMKVMQSLKSLQASLRHLTWKTQRIAEGDFNQKVDFMGDFSEAFNSMILQLKSAFEEIEIKKNILQEKNEQLENELILARSIQQSLIPNPLQVENLEIYSKYIPMMEIGGDYYDFLQFKERNKIGFFISDVSGHGVHAALISGMVKALINTADENRLKPKDMLKYINSRIMGLTGGNFLTAFYGIYDQDKRTITYSRGGHNPPYVIRDGSTCFELGGRGKLLGVFDDIDFEEITVDLFQGDKILIYTDGLIESINKSGKLFEETLISDVLIPFSDLKINDYVETIYRKLVEFRGEENFDDDICMIGIEIG